MAKNLKIQLNQLAVALLKLRSTEEIITFLTDLLTPAEQEILSVRLKVAKLLAAGIPYAQIVRETGASSATVAKVSENLKYGEDGYKLVISRLNPNK